MTDTGVSVAVVNFNGGRRLDACLTALAEQSIPHRTIVVDNASTDGSLDFNRKHLASVRWIPLRANVGYARAINIAARLAEEDSDILVTLNPDTIPRPDFVERVVEPLAEERVASVSGTLVFQNKPEVVASAGVRVFRNGVALDAQLGSRYDPNRQPAEVFGASGGAAAYRLDAFREAGGLSSPFFLYLEDVDLAWRLRLLGWRAISAPGAVVAHAYSASSREGSAFKRRLLSRNRVWTIARCLPSELWRRHCREIMSFDARALAWAALHGDVAMIGGRLEGLARLPVRLCERRQIQRSRVASIDDLDRWIEPSIPDRELLRLRRLTAELAAPPAATP